MAASLPSIKKTQAFQAGDVLVSNIRPYFKKIWYARFAGGCSNDVLVFRSKANVNSRFLYYVLLDDTFFHYSTSTSKGTKMPRGDKKALMEYPVPTFSIADQQKIASILGSLDDKIELNNKINKNLEQQAQALFKSYFIDFEPFGGVCQMIGIFQLLEIPACVNLEGHQAESNLNTGAVTSRGLILEKSTNLELSVQVKLSLI